jgi:hypothetical protein
MSRNSTYRSPTLIHFHLHNNSPASSTRIVSYIGRQYTRAVPNADIVSSSKCHARHLATGGVARFNYVLVTDSNPVMTSESGGQIYPYPTTTSPCYRYDLSRTTVALSCLPCTPTIPHIQAVGGRWAVWKTTLAFVASLVTHNSSYVTDSWCLARWLVCSRFR